MAEKKKLPNLISARNSDLGFQYERLIGIYLAIKCVSRSDLDDFQLVFNAKDHGSIDDVVIRIFSQNKLTKVLLCQFKHKDNKGGVNLKKEFEKYENAYNLLLQDKMYSEDEIAVVLFTNGSMIFPEGITKNPIIFNDENILSIFYTNKNKGHTYQLSHESNAKYNSSFYNNWFHFGKQINAHGANKLISNCLGNHFTEKEIQQINMYFLNVLPKREEPFCKSDIISILSDILLNPFVFTHVQADAPIKNSNTNPLLFKTLKKFNITQISENNSRYLISCMVDYIEKNLNVQLSKLQWNQKLTKDIVDKLFNMGGMKTYAKLKNQNNPLTKKDLLLLFWSKGELPLLLKTDESNYEKIKFCLNNFTSKSKLSVVLCDEHNLVTNLNDDLTVFNNLFDLTQKNDELLHELLEDTKISLYLKETSLKGIVDKDEKMLKTINPDCFVELFCQSIKIPSILIKPPFYIDRQIEIKLYNKDVVQSKAFVAIVDADSSLPNLENYTDDTETIFYSKHTAEVTAKLVTEKIADKKFCCFQTFGDKFYCYLTNLPNLNPIERYSVNQLVCEKDLLNHPSASKIIHGPAGMGKTTFLQNLAGNSTTNHLNIYIHVNDIMKNDVYKYSFKSKESLADYLSTIINDSQKNNHLTSFISAFLLNCLNENRLQLLFDGFDETSASPEVFSRLLNELTVPFILCTRSEKITDLQVALRISTVFKLMEFDGNNQKKFVQEQTKNDSQVKPQEIIDKIVDEFSKTSILNFLGNPLLLKMITNIFQEIKKDLEQWNIVNILNKFIKKQMDEYQSEASKENVKKLACHVFFEDKILRKILINNKDVIALLNDFHEVNKTDGIISNVNAAKEVQFTHRVYAEFLCAQYLFELFTNANQDELKEYSKIYELLFAEDIIPVRYFLDLLLSQEIPLFTAILLNDYHKVKEICNHSGTNKIERDKLGRSVMHLLMGYGERYNYPYKIDGLKNIKTLKTYNLYKMDKQFSVNINILLEIKIYTVRKKFQYNKDLFENYPHTYGFYSRSYIFLKTISHNLKLSSVPEINKTTFFIYFIGYYHLYELVQACLKLPLYADMEWKMNGKERSSIVNFFKTFNTNIDDFDIEKINQTILNENFTILHMASMKDFDDIVDVIIATNLNLEHCKDSDDYTALDYAILNNNQYLMNLLKKNCISKIVWKQLNKMESESSSVYKAVINSNLNSLKLCIDQEYHLNSHVTFDGETILEIAARRASSEILCFLIDKMKPTKILMAKLLYCSMKYSNRDNINYLIKCEMDLGHEINKGTVMHWAAFYGDSDLILSLIEKGCDINVVDTDYRTPIFSAIKNQNIETLKCLIEQNVDLKLKDSRNWSVMHWAALYGNLEIIRMLKDHGGYIEDLDLGKKTPIYYSVEKKNMDSLRALIDLEANLKHETNNNASIMHHAAAFGNDEIITYLINKGCRIDKLNNRKQTPIYEAMYRGNIETLNCLRKHGAKLNDLSKNFDNAIKTISKRDDYERIFKIICSYEEVQQLGGMPYIKRKIREQTDWEYYSNMIEEHRYEMHGDDSFYHNDDIYIIRDRLLRFLEANEN